MFSADVQVLDFTAQDWLRLPLLFRPAASRSGDGWGPDPDHGGAVDLEPAASGTAGGIIAVRQGDRVVKVVSTVRGRLPPPEPGRTSARALAEEHGGSFGVVLSTTALEQLGDRFARRMSRGQSFHAQVEAIVAGMRELEQEGEIELWPSSFADWPLPTERAFGNALDLLCGDGKVLLVGAFDAGELFTALCLRRRGPAFDTVMGPDRLRSDMGLLSGDFSRDYRYLAAAVEARLGPVAAGCYAELSTLRRLAGESEPGAWASAFASREVVLTPVTPGLAVPLGLDAGRAALALAKSMASRFGFLQGLRAPAGLGPRFGQAYAFVENDVRRYLGFDPWRVLANWFRVRA
ncbi:MAG TPA: hypothetical protein VIW29_06610 [Polyangiaceae bacterium]